MHSCATHYVCYYNREITLSANCRRLSILSTDRFLPCSRRITREYCTKRVLNYYDMLETTPKASQKQIKAAYYRLSKKYHPDVNKSSDAQEKFAMIAEAYEVLGNRRTRSLYDSGSLSPSDLPGRGPTGGTAAEVDEEYREFFKNRSRGSSFRTREGEPMTGRTKIFDFDEFYRQHYGEAMRRTQQDKKERERMKQEDMEAKSTKRQQLTLYLLVMLSVSVMLFITRK